MYSRNPGAFHRATRYRWTFAEYSRTIFVAEPLGLRFLSPGSESKIIADESSHGGECQAPQNKAYASSVVTRSRKSKDCVTFSGKRENRASGGIGSARNGMLGSRIPPMHYFDLAIIIVYLVAITAFGACIRSGQKNLKDYFLGGRAAPWWAIGLSIVSAETSTLTIVGTPPLAFAANGNLGFLQIVFGYLLARVVISVVLLPQYFRGEMFTAYELMRRRFGERVRRLTASIFLVTRALAEGVRVFAISLVIFIVLKDFYVRFDLSPDTGEIVSIVLIVLLTLFYTFEGGMTAVIWTDVVQVTLYVAGAVASFVIILGKIPGGWAHGEHQSRTALMASWVVILVQFTLFLLIGVLLYVYYADRHLAAPTLKDSLYPAFVWNSLPPGLAGLIVAAILAAAMANLSAALN